MKKQNFVMYLFFMFVPSICLSQLETALARKIASDAFTAAEVEKRCISVALVDDSANLVYFERASCASLGSIETSIQKSKSSALFRKPTAEFVKAVKNGKIGILGASGVIAVEGGLPIIVGDKFIGAIGVGGATSIEDENFAKAALKDFDSTAKKKITP